MGERLLERTAETTALDAAIADAVTGRGRTVMIEGVAGIGKTTLLRYAQGEAQAAGMLALSATGSPLQHTTPFAVAVELFGRVPSEDGLSFDGPARFARHLLDPTAEAPAPRPSEDAAFSAMLGLHWLAEGLAETKPLALVVDDAQWADVPSLRLLEHLARRIAESPILLLVAVREGEPAEPREPLRRLRGEQTVTVLRPGSLSLEAVRKIVDEKLGDPAPEFLDACMRLSAGNPFYLGAVLDEARQLEIEPDAGQAATVSELRPDAIRRSLLEGLERLGDDARRVAQAVAVLGPSARLADAAAAAGLDPAGATAALDRLQAVAILASTDPPEFRHPLLAEAVRDALSASELRDLHLRCAKALHERNAPDEEVAAHLTRTRHVGEPWAWPVLRRAAALALSSGAPGEAAKLLQAAIDERPPAGERDAILVELGLAEAMAGTPDAARTLATALAAVRDPAVKAESYLTLGNLLFWGGQTVEACESLDQAANELEEWAGDEGTRALLFEIRMRSAAFGFFTAERHFEAAEQIEAFRAAGDLDGSTFARLGYGDLAEHALHQGNLDEARALAARGLENPRSADFRVMGFEAGTTQIALALALADDFDQAEAEITGAIESASESGSVLGLTASSFIRALVRSRRGLLDAAAADAELAITGYEYGLRLGVDLCHGVLAERALERGEYDEARRILDSLPGTDADWQFPTFADFLFVRSQLGLATGDVEGAIADAIGCGIVYKSIGATYPVRPWRSQAALGLLQRGDRDEANRLVEEELELAEAAGRERAYGVAQRTAALLSASLMTGWGVERLRESADVLARTQAELEHARSLVELGSALRRSGQRRECREPLKEGLVKARECGALVLAERAEQELLASGGRLPKRPLTGGESLTPTERRVAELAAKGLSNPDIAASLFVSRRTVETHLTHVYDKLDCGRADLADALA